MFNLLSLLQKEPEKVMKQKKGIPNAMYTILINGLNRSLFLLELIEAVSLRHAVIKFESWSSTRITLSEPVVFVYKYVHFH